MQAQGTAASIPQQWDLEADVVVIGSGASGMPAAIRAADAGVSVLVVDTNYDIGGHAINMKCQVMDMKGQVIPGLYCGGESAAGCSQHGLGRCTTQGFIAGREAAHEPG